MHQQMTSKGVSDEPQRTLGQPCGHHNCVKIVKLLLQSIGILVVWMTRLAQSTPVIGQRGKAWGKIGHLLSPGSTTFSPPSHEDEARGVLLLLKRVGDLIGDLDETLTRFSLPGSIHGYPHLLSSRRFFPGTTPETVQCTRQQYRCSFPRNQFGAKHRDSLSRSLLLPSCGDTCIRW